MSTAAEVIETIKEAIPGVCGSQNSKIQRAQKFVLDNGEDIPVILEGLNKICGGIFISRAGLILNIPQAQAEIVDVELVAVGRTPPSDLALKKKVGNAALDTTADDLSEGLNEVNTKASLGVSKATTAQSGVDIVNSEIGDLLSLTTGTTTSLVGAINEHESEIGNLNLLSTAERGSLVGAINEVASSGGGGVGSIQSEVDEINSVLGPVPLETASQTIKGAINEHESEIGDLNSLITPERGNLVDAINEVASSGGGGGFYDPIGNLGTVVNCITGEVIASGSTVLAEMLAAQQKCAKWAEECAHGSLDYMDQADGLCLPIEPCSDDNKVIGQLKCLYILDH